MTTSAAFLGLLGLLFPIVLTGLAVWFAVWVVLTLKRHSRALDEIRDRLNAE
ncbi:hypothetical protein RWH45_06540 [Microbacterium sp. KSW4-17]|uniref:Uncharacterized protein n=1 Tax=Microbacterium galbum TaxID=3075994 RepID=A0ABU3T683_9MICO|nr:hypothetical protein [Microbacterium sp. KSW4-17]MDU0366867.1 hypothetical protein [Microbacterium sp. KSW4-17]